MVDYVGSHKLALILSRDDLIFVCFACFHPYRQFYP